MATDKVAIEGEDKTKIAQAKQMVDDYMLAKNETDRMIAKISNPVIKAKYESQKKSQRGTFSDSVDALTAKFLQLAAQVEGWFSSPTAPAATTKPIAPKGTAYGEMGLLPLALAAPWAIKVGLVAAASAIIYAAVAYATALKKERELQEMILKDPSLSVSEKNSLLSVVSSSGGFGGAIALVGIGAVLVFLVMRMKK